MLNNISWQGYWITIALLSAAYYLAVYLLYFRKDFSIQWNKSAQSKFQSPLHAPAAGEVPTESSNGLQPSLFNGAEEFGLPEEGTLEHTVYACADEISAYLKEVGHTRCVKEELLFALHSILRKYPAIFTSTYKDSLTTVIQNQCEQQCSVHLDAEDVVQMWGNG